MTISRRPPKSLSDSFLMAPAALPPEDPLPEELPSPVSGTPAVPAAPETLAVRAPSATALKVTVPSLAVFVELAPKVIDVMPPVVAAEPVMLVLELPPEPALPPLSMPPPAPGLPPVTVPLLLPVLLSVLPLPCAPPFVLTADGRFGSVETMLPAVFAIEAADTVASNAVALLADCTTE